MPRSARLGAVAQPILVIAVLVAATVLRFASLQQRGLIYWDESKYALEGLRLQELLQAHPDAHLALVAGKTIGTAKPTHALLIALSFLLFGDHDYAPLLVNAAASVAQVVLVYVVGRRMFGPIPGLVAAALLAVSEYDVIYARSALSESDGNLLLLGGVLLWLASWRRRPGGDEWLPNAAAGRLFAAGLFFGLAFTTNYRLGVYIAAIVGFDLLWCWRSTGIPLRRIPVWAAGLLVAPAAWQVVDWVTRSHGLTLFRSEQTGRPEWYWRQVLYQVHGGKQAVFHFSPIIYLQWYILREGRLAFGLIVVGLGLALWRRTFPWLVAAVAVLIPYAVYVFAPFFVPRNLAASVPFASLAAAAALMELLMRIPQRVLAGALMVAAAVVLVVVGATMSWRLTAERSGFAAAATYIRQHDGGRALTTSEVMVYYLGSSGDDCGAPALPLTLQSLDGYVRHGFIYAVLERHHSSVSRYVHRHALRVVRIPATGRLSIGENPISTENSNPPNAARHTEYVDVFRLDRLRLPAPPPHFDPECGRDSVT